MGGMLKARLPKYWRRKFSPMTGELSTLILSGVPAPRASPNAVPAEDQAVPSGARLISVEPIEVRKLPMHSLVVHTRRNCLRLDLRIKNKRRPAAATSALQYDYPKAITSRTARGVDLR